MVMVAILESSLYWAYGEVPYHHHGVAMVWHNMQNLCRAFACDISSGQLRILVWQISIENSSGCHKIILGNQERASALYSIMITYLQHMHLHLLSAH